MVYSVIFQAIIKRRIYNYITNFEINLHILNFQQIVDWIQTWSFVIVNLTKAYKYEL